ncbi:uncharacterized protein LOC130892900 [Diorhabda carinulata]|uniref:uncharacterized protein LOC130892900 n=1 Tax=Diorhabda carinulata TaxID=1163345 RepID=UPI0025A1F115|nr:uncharacterized protein LOC130892900 [Diorhabda carinulata]
MAQAFITTAKNTYRWNVQEKTKPIKQEKYYDECYGKNVEWLTEKDLGGKITEHFEEIEKAVKELQAKRMSLTTYRTDYCKDWKKVIDSESKEDIVENELAKHFEQLYEEKKTRKILPTIESQRILGFLASSRMYTPITTYQNDYGRLGYERLPKILTKT